MLSRLAGMVAALLVAAPAGAHEGEPPVPEGQVAINFALPEMDGTVSLGIYDAGGKLVRTLHREAPGSAFVKGLNGLITYWDGKDDAGKGVKAGKFAARGCVVGDVAFEGEAYHFNDWIAGAESPRTRRILDFAAMPEEALYFEAEVLGGERKAFIRDREGKVSPAAPMAAIGERSNSPDRVDDSFDSAGNVWVIEKTADEVAVKQFAPSGEFLRRLAIKAGEPMPVKISVAPDAEAIYLLEEDAALQRVRKLTLESAPAQGGEAVSTWRSAVLGTIRFSARLDQVRGNLTTAAAKTFIPAGTIRVALVANPLKQEEKPSAEIGVAVEKGGSFLQLPDGLPLRRMSGTPGLLWAAIGRDAESGVVTIFQGDGAVVEEFTARGLEKMIALDAGEIEFPSVKAKEDERNDAL